MSQAELDFSPVENGGLFSANFLQSRLPEWPEFGQLDCTELMAEVMALWEREGPGLAEANEAQVEDHFVQPILDLLGHAWTPQAGWA